MSNESKLTAREFWMNPDEVFWAEPFGTHSSKYVRVIEYSAYLEVKKERDEYLNGYNNLLANESDMQRKLDDQIKRLIEERDNLKLQANALAEALEFYADKNNWTSYGNMNRYIIKGNDSDNVRHETLDSVQDIAGARAREALAKFKKGDDNGSK